MPGRMPKIRLSASLILPLFLLGCATERAMVSFSYAVNPTKGLPPGMKVITIEPANIGETTDPKWSELCVSILNSLVNESKSRFGTDVLVSDRRDADVTFDEADLRAAGMATETGQQGGRVLGAHGAIRSTINVKVDEKIGRQRTLSGLMLGGGGGHGFGGGATDIQTEEVETVTRTMVVQTEFKLLDTANNRVWDYSEPMTYRSTEATQASPIFGSSQTAAELTPEDEIIGALVERGARRFISRLMPTTIQVDAVVESSVNADCVRGVKMLRGTMYDTALANFKNALAEDSDDHQAAFGAGLACEAMGRYDEALRYYKQACVGAADPQYAEARDRLTEYGSRVRP
ncbi:MAG: tetratricopeptide repeat protein [Phycisphaerales bacterium]|nr:MAG: tetratricopeptide repeat protein [Phycisphaerales bacterium]